MREIKFRGIRIDSGRDDAGLFVYGNSIILGNTEAGIVSGVEKVNAEGSLLVAVVKPETVGQYTGLNLDGKELYEGDLLRRWLPESKMINLDGGEWWICEIRFLYGAWRVCQVGFDYREDYHPELLYDELRDYDYELIGNIHNNPELIKP